MKKIPTLFVRDRSALGRTVLPELHPDCGWVLAGEGTATRMYDGRCVHIRRDGLAARVTVRTEVQQGTPDPHGYFVVDFDTTTGATVGWAPAEHSDVARLIHLTGDEPAGTYELCGPQVNGNPEGLTRHELIPHATADPVELLLPMDPAGAWLALRAFMVRWPHHGIVWRHPTDGRQAKIKRRDFPSPFGGCGFPGCGCRPRCSVYDRAAAPLRAVEVRAEAGE